MKKEVQATGLEDRIDRYLLGYMNENERSAFESEMSSDNDLADEVNIRHMVISSVQEHGSMRDRLLSVEAGIRRKENIRRTVVGSLVSLLSAASIAFCIYLRVEDVGNCRSVAGSVYLADMITPSRGGFNFDEIIKAIDESRFSDAHALIDSYRSTPVPEYDLSTETGKGYYAQYRFDMQTLDYIEAIAYMKEGRPVKARRALKMILADETSYYQASAEEFLDKL